MSPERAVQVVNAARDMIESQQAEIEDLKKRNAAMETAASFLQRYAVAVHMHNLKCDAECDKGFSCGYEGFLKRTGRACAGCPARFKVDPMPAEGIA
jgi:FtsZ-binding cell division protein ZapB